MGLQCILDVLTLLDIFGTQVTLCYKKNYQFKTAFGGVVAISCIVVVIVLCISYVKLYSNLNKRRIHTIQTSSPEYTQYLNTTTDFTYSFLQKLPLDLQLLSQKQSDLIESQQVDKTTIESQKIIAQVTFVQSVNYSRSPSNLLIGSNTTMIAVQYDQTNFVTRPQVNITLLQGYYQRFPNGTVVQTKTNYNLEPCTLDHFVNLPEYKFNWTTSFYEENISDFLCLPKDVPFYIGGVYENTDFYFVKFTVTKCVNSTANPNMPWNPTCETPSVISSNIDNTSRVRFLISNNNLSPEKPTGSITSFLDSQIFNLQIGTMYTAANIFFNKQTLTTDESLLPVANTDTAVLNQFKSGDTQKQMAMGDFPKYGEFFFERSNYSTVAYKSYLKIDQVLSYIGGFCSMFFIFSAFIVKKYNNMFLYNELANQLYDFEITENMHPKRNNNSPDSDAKELKPTAIQLLRFKQQQQQKSQHQKNIESKQTKMKKYLSNYNAATQENQTLNAAESKDDKAEGQNYIELQNSPSPQTFLNKADLKEEDRININSNSPQLQPANSSYSPSIFNKVEGKHSTFHRNSSLQQSKLLNKKSSSGENQQDNQLEFNLNTVPGTNVAQSNNVNNNEQKDNTVMISQMNPQRKYSKKQTISIGGDTNQFLENQLKSVIDKDRSLSLSCKYVINFITFGKFCNTEEVLLLNKAFNLVSEDLDILTILNRQKEVDKMKKLYFDEPQQVLFNFFPKPLIKVKDDVGVLDKRKLKQDEEELNDNVQKIQKQKSINISNKSVKILARSIIKFKKGKEGRTSNYQKLFEHYQKLHNKCGDSDHQGDVNRKLIDLLGNEMKTIFEVANFLQKKEEDNPPQYSSNEKLKNQKMASIIKFDSIDGDDEGTQDL